MSERPGMRRFDAEEVNRLASELDEQPYSAEPADASSSVGPDTSTDTDRHMEHDVAESDVTFPPEVESDSTIGGSVEDRAILREENSGPER